MWDLSSLTRDQTHVPSIGRWILNHWTTRKVPELFLESSQWLPCAARAEGCCSGGLWWCHANCGHNPWSWDQFNGFSSVQFTHSVMSDSLRTHGLQHARPPCPLPTPRVYPNPCPLSGWCHPAISSSVIPFSSCLQFFPASGSFPMSQFFASGGQSIAVSASASVLPMNNQDLFPLGWTGWVSLLSKGPSRVFSNTTVQKHQFFRVQLSL